MVNWEYYLWDGDRPASEADLKRVEGELGVRLPADYWAVVRLQQGKTPDPYRFDFIEDGRPASAAMGPLFHFLAPGKAGPNENYGLLQNLALRREQLPPGVIPFSEDGSGNQLAFDYRADKDAPPVVFVNHDAQVESEWISRLADSFSDFLAGLYEDEDDPFADDDIFSDEGYDPEDDRFSEEDPFADEEYDDEEE